jgi:hypothetical protein
MEAHLLSVRTENKCANIRKTISCIYKLFKSSLPIPFNLCFLGWCDMPFEPFRNLKRWQRQNKIPFVMLLCKCFPLLCKSHYRKRSGETGGKGNYSNCHDMPSKSYYLQLFPYSNILAVIISLRLQLIRYYWFIGCHIHQYVKENTDQKYETWPKKMSKQIKIQILIYKCLLCRTYAVMHVQLKTLSG